MTDETLKLRPWQKDDLEEYLAKHTTDPQVKEPAWDVAVRTGMSVDDVTAVLERTRAGGHIVIFGPRAGGRQALYMATMQLLIGGVPFPMVPAREIRAADVFPLLTIPRASQDENRPWKPGDPRLPAFLRKRNARHQDARRSARKNRR